MSVLCRNRPLRLRILKIIFVVCVSVSVAVSLIFTLTNESDTVPERHFEISANTTRLKNIRTILFWNNFFGMQHFGMKKGTESFSQCRIKSCGVWDRDDPDADIPQDMFDAVLFHGIETSGASKSDLPPVRRSRQRYVFLLQESPAMRPNIYDLNNFFNWTLTYRYDSDIYAPYGHIRRIEETTFVKNYEFHWRTPSFDNMTIPDSVANKTRPIAWMVANHMTLSDRDRYVRRLEKFIPVDIYGKTGRECVGYDCLRLLENTYKFYLSFENSLCDDYVTEKFYRALQLNMVPIVYGGANYKKLAPPMSFIDVKDYSSPKDLANYIIYLDKNPREYEKYFWWRTFYTSEGAGGEDTWCRLCAMLNNDALPSKSYPDMRAWWFPEGVCQTPARYFQEGRFLMKMRRP